MELVGRGLINIGIIVFIALPFIIARLAMERTIKKAEAEHEDWRKNVFWGTIATKEDYYRRHGKRP